MEVAEDGTIRPVLHHHDSLMNLFRLNEDGTIGDMVDIAKHQVSEELRFTLLDKPVMSHPTHPYLFVNHEHTPGA